MNVPSLLAPARETIAFFRIVIYARWATLASTLPVLVGIFAASVAGIAFGGGPGLGGGFVGLVIVLLLSVVMGVWYRRRRRHPFDRFGVDLNPKALRTPRTIGWYALGIAAIVVGLPLLLIGQQGVWPALAIPEAVIIGIGVLGLGPQWWGYSRREQIADRYFARHPDQLRALRDSIARSRTVGEAMYRLASWTPQR